MTQQDDITLRVLTDEQIMRSAISACDSLNITRFHEIGAPSKTIMDDAGLLELGRAIESAVLSKLRAPVADERAQDVDLPWLRAYMHHQIASDRWVVTADQARDFARAAVLADRQARAALASAPVAVEQHDGLRTLLAELPGMHEDPKKGDAVFRCGVNGALNVVERRIRELLRSAPVADERAAFKKCHSAIIKALASIAMADGPDTRKADDPELLYRSPVMDDVVRIRVALDECSAALASAPVAGEAVCKTCGGSRVDPGGLPICRDCGPVAGEAQCAERDMLEEARAEIEMIREALGVSYEPHQSLFDRMLEACDGIRHAAKARGMLEWIGPNGTAAGPALVADVPGGWVRCNADGANIGGNFLTLLQEIAEDSAQADKDGCTCPSGDGSLRHPCPTHPQADKGGGQQRAAFDHPVFAFLLGEGPLHGVHFGDRHPSERGAYWWRKDLRAALSATQAEQGERDA